MSNVIKLRNGTSTPGTGDITDKEVAIDLTAQSLYVNDSDTIKQIGLPTTGGTMTGDIDMNNSTISDARQLSFNATGASPSVNAVYDEDDMSSDSNQGIATQQSIKAYVDDTARQFCLSQSFYSRISTPNIYIMNRTGATHTTGGTSATSFDAEALLHGVMYSAGETTTLVGARAWIGTGGTSTEDLDIYIITTNAYTSDQTGTITSTLSSTLSQAGSVTQNDAYYVADGAINQAMTAGQAVMIGVSIGSGTNQYVQGSITLDFEIAS